MSGAARTVGLGLALGIGAFATGFWVFSLAKMARASSPPPLRPAVPGAATPSPAAPKPKPAGGIYLKRGSSGALVTQWQTMIGEPSTGVFSDSLVFATKEFQRAHGLTVDGIVGPKTWKAAGGT